MSTAREYARFSLSQRAQHWVIVISFALLAVTGLPQKFAGDGWAETILAWMGGIENVRLVHHASAIVLLIASILHGVDLMYKVIVQRTRWTIYPQLQDLMDAIQAVLHNLGLRKDSPRFDHFSFGEKFEYWALVWGTLVMALTGFMLWNPIITTRFVSGDVIPAAKATHGAEAILAVLAVLVWHLYNVHLKSFNRSMFTGTMPAHEMEAEHALEFERMERGAAGGEPDPAKLMRRRRVFLPIAAVVSFALLFAVLLFTTAETTAVTTLPLAAVTVQVYAPQTHTPTAVLVLGAKATPGPVGAAPAVPADHAGRTVCTACHASGVGGAPKSPPDHANRLDAACLDCHKPR